jgi:hypothetical protein
MVKDGLIQPPASSIKPPEVCGFSRRISQSGKSPLPPSNLKNLFFIPFFVSAA